MAKTRFFQQITIASGRPEQCRAELEALLGQSGNPFELGNVGLEIRLDEHSVAEGDTYIDGITLHCDALAASAAQLDMRGLELKAAKQSAAEISQPKAAVAGITAVDHIVLMSNNADDCIRLFRDDLGMRLALDQMVPKWGGRMLFFREGSMTLEVIHNLKEPPERDRFWGISYRCEDVQATCLALSSRGVALSEVRSGRKPGTLVASIKSHCAGIPSLLVGPA